MNALSKGADRLQAADDSRGRSVIRVDRSWWSAAGANGGVLAAAGLAAMRSELAQSGQHHPAKMLSVQFFRPVDERPLAVDARIDRFSGTTAVASFAATRNGEVALLGNAVFGASRPGVRIAAQRPPDVPSAEHCEPFVLSPRLAPYGQHLEIRAATPARPLAGGDLAELLFWIRFTDGRALDGESVTLLTDAMPPAAYAVLLDPVPMPTVELSVHLGEALSEKPADGWALVSMRNQQAASGWAIDDCVVWSADGELLALGRQTRRIIQTTRGTSR
jgi:acyl-CoA thioesterase